MHTIIQMSVWNQMTVTKAPRKELYGTFIILAPRRLHEESLVLLDTIEKKLTPFHCLNRVLRVPIQCQ